MVDEKNDSVPNWACHSRCLLLSPETCGQKESVVFKLNGVLSQKGNVPKPPNPLAFSTALAPRAAAGCCALAIRLGWSSFRLPRSINGMVDSGIYTATLRQ